MGLRDKVALVVATAIITQITIADCMPSTSRKASFQRYLDSFKQTKTSSVAKPTCNKEIFKSIKPKFSKCKNARLRQQVETDKSLYEVFNFPETEYSLDTFSRDPFYSGASLKTNSFGISQNTNPQSDAFNNLRKEMRMKRKLNRSTNIANYNTNSEMPSFTEFSSVPELICSKDPVTFPQVQYPTNAMETWMPHYWNPTLFNPYAGKNSEFPVCDPGLSENITIFYKPYKQQLKSKTQQFMEQIEKLKEKMRSTSSSKPVVNTSELNTNSSTYGETSEDVKNSDLSNNNVSPANVEPVVNNQTQMIPSNIDDDKYLVNTSSSNNCESVDTNTQMDNTTTESITDSMEAVNSQLEGLPMTPVPMPYQKIGLNDMCSVNDTQSMQNETIDYTNETNNPLLTETVPVVDKTDSLTNSSTIESNNANEGDNQPESIEKLPIDTLPVNVPSDADNGISTDNTTIVQNDSGSSSNVLEPLDVNSTKPSELGTVNSSPNCMPDEELKERPITEMPYSSIFVVPVGDSISKIQLPIMESNTGAPIILILPSRSKNEEFIITSNSPACNKICDTCSNIQPTPMEYIFEIPSATICNEMLPNNSMCYISTPTVNTPAPENTITPKNDSMVSDGNNGQSVTVSSETAKNDTSIPMSTNLPGTSQTDYSDDSGTNTGSTEILPIDTGTTETSVPNATSPSENSQPDDSTTLSGNNGQSGTAPTDTIKNDTSVTEIMHPPKTEQPDNYSGLNGQTVNMPTDTNDTSMPKDASSSENSQPAYSTPSEGDNAQNETASPDTVTNNTSMPETTNSPDVAQPDNSGDSGSSNEQIENMSTDTNKTSVPKNTNLPESSQPDDSTASGGDNGQSGNTSSDHVENNTSVPENTNPSETSQPDNSGNTDSNNESTEISPTETGINDTSIPNDTSPSKDLQPDNSTASSANNGPNGTASTNTTKNDTSVPESTNPPATSQPGNSGNTGPNNGQTENMPIDINDTSVLKDTSPSETSESDRSNENTEQIVTAPTDVVENDTSVPESTNPSETSQPDDSGNSGLKNEQTEITPTDTNKNDTSVPKDISPTENSQSDTSTGSQETETAPTEVINNDTLVPQNTPLPETLQPDNSLASQPNSKLDEITPTNILNNDTPITKDKESPEVIQNIDPNTVLDDKPMPVNMDQTLTPLTDNSLNPELDKGLSNKVVPNMPADDKLPSNSPTDNINDSGLDKGLPKNTVPVSSDKTLPTGMDLPLTLLTDNPKISELDKRLADTPYTEVLESDTPLNGNLPETSATDITKYPGLNKGFINTSHRDSVTDRIAFRNTKNIPRNSLTEDAKTSKTEKSPAKQVKSKLVYTYKAQSNTHEHQKLSDVTERLCKDDNPERVDIELPLNSPSDRKLADMKIINSNKKDIDKTVTSSSGNIKVRENTLGENKASIPLPDKMPRDAHLKSDLRREEAIEDFPKKNIETIHGTLSHSVNNESVLTNKELTSAELKDLIKYLYISV